MTIATLGELTTEFRPMWQLEITIQCLLAEKKSQIYCECLLRDKAQQPYWEN